MAWAPTGDRLAFFVSPDAAESWRLEVWGVDGTALHSIRVPHLAQVHDIEWAANGRFVLAGASTLSPSRHILVFFDTVNGGLYEIEFDAGIYKVFASR